MSDIVERLRAPFYHDDETLREAADEIERLRQREAWWRELCELMERSWTDDEVIRIYDLRRLLLLDGEER